MSTHIVTPPGTVGIETGLDRIEAAMRPHYPRFSPAEYARRYAAVRAAMARAGIECLLVHAGGYCVGSQKNLHYLSNLISYLPAYLVFPIEGAPTLYMLIYSFVPGGRAISIIDDVRWSLTVDGPAETLAELGLERGRIGIVGEDLLSSSLPHDHFERLQARLPGATFENFTAAMHAIMKIPSAEELAWFRRGAAYSDLGVEALVASAAPGNTDNEVYAEIQRAYLSQPHGVFYFTWIGSTPMAAPTCAYPFGLPSGRVLQRGDIVLSEISGAYHGYAGQIMRPVALGPPPAAYRTLFARARDVYQRTQEVLKPGNTPRDVLEISRGFLDAGYSTQCPTIHGWGQRIVPPFADVPGSSVFAADLDVPFEDNQLIVIEPSPCTRDTTAGMFVGDLNRVTPGGGESLHGYPFEFIVKD